MDKMIDISRVGGTAEVAEVLKCPKQQVHAFRRREEFPKPIRMLAATPLWDLDEIVEFSTHHRRRRSN